MKKTIFISIMIFAALVLSVSCSNSGKTPKKDSYTVTFDLKGGKCKGLDTKQTVKAGDTVDEPVFVPTASDDTYYRFDYWAKADGTEYNFSATVNSDITLYAKYKERYNVGDKGPDGGYIFYKNTNYEKDSSDSDKNWKYLEVATKDFDAVVSGSNTTLFKWGTFGVSAGTSTSLGSGSGNTKSMAEKFDENYLAKNVYGEDWNTQGWHVPSKDELVELYNFVVKEKKEKQEKQLEFTSEDYWTSSEDGNDKAWCLKFDGGTTPTPQSVSRSTECRVRLIRKF